MTAIRTNTGIAGLVAAVPKRVVRNCDIPGADRAALFTGVQQRRHVGDVDLLDLELAGARCLLAKLGWSSDDVDFLVHVSQTPRHDVPAAAYVLHAALNLPRSCVVAPLNWSCAGYVMGLYTTSMLLAAAPLGSKALLVVGDATSSMCRQGDTGTYPLFGDASSVTALTSGGADATFRMGSDGAGWRKLSALDDEYLQMNGPEVLRFALNNVPTLTANVLADGPVDTLLFHQASKTVLDAIVRKTHPNVWNRSVPPDVPYNIADYGNCSSASIPLLWATSVPRNAPPSPVSKGRRHLGLVGFGAGWAWAGANLSVPDNIPVEYIEV